MLLGFDARLERAWAADAESAGSSIRLYSIAQSTWSYPVGGVHATAICPARAIGSACLSSLLFDCATACRHAVDGWVVQQVSAR